MAPDYEEPDQEVVKSPLVFTKQGASGSESPADHMPRHRCKRTDDVMIIDIAKLSYYVEHPINRWWDNS